MFGAIRQIDVLHRAFPGSCHRNSNPFCKTAVDSKHTGFDSLRHRPSWRRPDRQAQLYGRGPEPRSADWIRHASSEGESKCGRPEREFKPRDVKIARLMAAGGATDEEIREALQIGKGTFNKWRSQTV